MGKKQHYIPQFYLTRFADPRSSVRKRIIWVYEKGKVPRASTPREEAHENYYYTYVDESGTQKTVEDKFAEIESVIAPIFRKVDDRRCFFSPEEKKGMAIFLALMFTRVPMGRALIDRISARVARQAHLSCAQDEIQFKAAYEGVCREQEKQASLVQMEDLRKFILSGEYEVTQESRSGNIAKVFEGALSIGPILLKSNWQILHTKSEARFVTSDNPILTIQSDGPGHANVGMGFGMPGVDVCFPLGPTNCLRIANHREEGIFAIPGRKVRSINKILMVFAQRFLYAPEKSDKLAELFTRNGCKLIYGVNAFAPPPHGLPEQ